MFPQTCKLNKTSCQLRQCFLNPVQETAETLTHLYIWLNGVTFCLISVIGVAGNVITIIVFSKKELRFLNTHFYVIM